MINYFYSKDIYFFHKVSYLLFIPIPFSGKCSRENKSASFNGGVFIFSSFSFTYRDQKKSSFLV